LFWLDKDCWDISRKIEQWTKEVQRGGGTEVYFQDDTDIQLQTVLRKISEIEKDYETLYKMRTPALERLLLKFLSDYDVLVRVARRIQKQIWHRLVGSDSSVNDNQVAKARNIPLEHLVEVDRSRRTLCLFHDDTNPSLYVKNGFGYCFSCGAWCDSIKYSMKKYGLSFAKAVETLAEV